VAIDNTDAQSHTLYGIALHLSGKKIEALKEFKRPVRSTLKLSCRNCSYAEGPRAQELVSRGKCARLFKRMQVLHQCEESQAVSGIGSSVKCSRVSVTSPPGSRSLSLKDT
jgi:hypothetical protein